MTTERCPPQIYCIDLFFFGMTHVEVGGFANYGRHFEGPHSKDYSMVLGSPICGRYHMLVTPRVQLKAVIRIEL